MYLIESILSISPPFDAAELVVTVILLEGTIGFPKSSTTLPEYEKFVGPFPSFPSVIM